MYIRNSYVDCLTLTSFSWFIDCLIYVILRSVFTENGSMHYPTYIVHLHVILANKVQCTCLTLFSKTKFYPTGIVEKCNKLYL